jgi:type IV pilus assembly protein PilB
MQGDFKKHLADILLCYNLLDQEKLNKALEIQKKEGGRLSAIVVKLGFVKENDLISCLSKELSIPPISLERYKIDTTLSSLIPKRIALHYQIIPISRIGNVLTVAMSDPLNIFAIDDLRILTGLEIAPLITTQEEIEKAIGMVYEDKAAQKIEDIVKDIDKEQLLTLSTKDSAKTGDSQEMVILDTPVVKITNMILAKAVDMHASDVLVEPQESALRIRCRVDGILQEIDAPPHFLHSQIISRIKIMSDLNIAEHRLPQDGRFKAKIHGREVDFRVSILPSSFGEKAALRILDKTQAMLDVETLGFDKDSLKALKEASSRPHGMILICGPTGCGKTTTLYSLLKLVDSPGENLVTVEDPVEYELAGINQVTIKPDIGLTFASSLRSILRQDPDVIMVGEIRDFETVDIAIKSALTGHLVLSTLHTNNACGAIVRLINMDVEPFLITSSLILVGAQRLLRKLCTRCRKQVAFDEAMFEKFGVPLKDSDKKSATLFKPVGCKFCRNTGYSGRTGIIETLTLSEKIQHLIMKSATEREIFEAAREEGMGTLREKGVEKVLKGETSIEEIVRVTAGEEIELK